MAAAIEVAAEAVSPEAAVAAVRREEDEVLREVVHEVDEGVPNRA